MILRIGHTAFAVRDLEASLGFYRDALGFQEVLRMHRDDGGVWFVYLWMGGDSYLELFPGNRDRPDPGPGAIGYSHMCLDVDDIHAIVAELTARGLAIDRQPELNRAGNWSCLIRDPDGNRIELMQVMVDRRPSQSPR